MGSNHTTSSVMAWLTVPCMASGCLCALARLWPQELQRAFCTHPHWVPAEDVAEGAASPLQLHPLRGLTSAG